jgi:hypothetical protein
MVEPPVPPESVELEDAPSFSDTAATGTGMTPIDAPVDGGALLGAGCVEALCTTAGGKMVAVGAAA